MSSHVINVQSVAIAGSACQKWTDYTPTPIKFCRPRSQRYPGLYDNYAVTTLAAR